MKSFSWHGFDAEEFEFEGKRAILVFPDKASSQKDWLLKTEYWDAFPEREIDLINRGFHLAYMENETRFATYSDCARKARFAEFLAEKYALREVCVPVGMSCGGAHAVNFAGFFPEKVACLFLEAPVMNFCSYPARLGDSDCEKVWENEFVKAYPGITRATLLNFDNHPIGKIAVLKEHDIPIVMMYGTEDKTVPYRDNGKLLELEYANDSNLLVIPRPAQGHHPHGYMHDPAPLLDFIENACKNR